MTCIDEVARAVSVGDGVSSVALSKVGVAESIGTDGNGGDGRVGEEESHEVEGQVVDDGGAIGVSVVVSVCGFISGLLLVFVEEVEELLSGVAEGEAGDPGADANDATKGEVLVSLKIVTV